MKLLVSVRNAAELHVALDCGVHVIDLKEPRSGPLGAVQPDFARKAVAETRSRASLSVALGELIDYSPGSLPDCTGFQFAKIGLSQLNSIPLLRKRWRAWAETLPPDCTPVVVAYADHENADSIPAGQLAQFACEMNATWFLIDTWTKNGKRLTDWLPVPILETITGPLPSRGIRTVLAGSLDLPSIQALVHLPISMFAVRGAVCAQGSRGNSVERARIREWMDVIANIDWGQAGTARKQFPGICQVAVNGSKG